MLFIGLISIFIVGGSGNDDYKNSKGNVAVIPIKGVILTEGDNSYFSGGEVASSQEIIKLIDEANNNPKVKAIILEINSPGGSAVASDEIGTALKKVNKTKVAWVREIGTSGAYWVASGCDQIIANKMSITGSIGVISSYLEFGGLLSDYNVTYQRLIAGKYKDIGSPYREMTSEEKEILKKQLSIIHDYFIIEVANNRGLSEKKTRELANGQFYLGIEAKDLGLIDILGGKDEAINYIENKEGIKADLTYYSSESSFMDILMGSYNQGSFNIGKGIAAEFKEQKPQQYSINLI